MRLIDADKVLKKKFRVIKPSELGVERYYVSEDDINNAPTVDAVPVVRCKDCKYCSEIRKGSILSSCKILQCCVTEDWFCAYGEKRTDETN